jgi:hypothetical protein
MINLLLLLVGLLVLMAIGVGLYIADDVEMGIDICTFRWTSFELGITNRNYSWDNGDEEQELRIGLIFITFFVSFFRNSA